MVSRIQLKGTKVRSEKLFKVIQPRQNSKPCGRKPLETAANTSTSCKKKGATWKRTKKQRARGFLIPTPTMADPKRTHRVVRGEKLPTIQSSKRSRGDNNIVRGSCRKEEG